MSFGPSVRNGLGIGLGPTATLATAFSQATLDFDFIDNQVFPTDITFTRASSATYFNSAGVLTSASNNVPRLDYNPATLAPRGLLIEEQRTNSIRNNTMQGAVAGTPGTLPTNWAVSGLGTLTQQVVGVGTVAGINYIDLRFSGTTSSPQLGIRFEPANGAGGTNGQTFTFSTWIARVGGSLTNVSDISANANIYSSTSVYLTSIAFSGIPGQSAGTTLDRVSGAGTIASATAAFIQPQIYINFASGVAIDITLRIGLPQLEQGAFATSVIPTTIAAATRSADVASVNTLSPWWNSAAGTFYTEFSVPQLGRAGRLAAVDDGSLTNMVDTTVSATNGVAIEAVAAGVYGGFASAVGSITANTTQKSAFTFSTSASETACLNAGTVGSGAVTLPSVSLTRLLLGRQSNGVELCGYLRRLTFYPRQLSNAELQALTA